MKSRIIGRCVDICKGIDAKVGQTEVLAKVASVRNTISAIVAASVPHTTDSGKVVAADPVAVITLAKMKAARWDLSAYESDKPKADKARSAFLAAFGPKN